MFVIAISFSALWLYLPAVIQYPRFSIIFAKVGDWSYSLKSNVDFGEVDDRLQEAISVFHSEAAIVHFGIFRTCFSAVRSSLNRTT